jgi:hypothetical protein
MKVLHLVVASSGGVLVVAEIEGMMGFAVGEDFGAGGSVGEDFVVVSGWMP